MLAIVFVVALLAYSTAVITDSAPPTAAGVPVTGHQWDAIAAGLEHSGEAAAASATATTRRKECGRSTGGYNRRYNGRYNFPDRYWIVVPS